jgi:hypothetical protein
MKIRGIQTSYIDVEVSSSNVYEAFVDHFARSAFTDQNCRPLPLSTRDDQYINDEGFWEIWEYEHGSGYTTVKRKATDEEAKAMEIYKTLKSLRSMYFSS